MDNFGAEVAKKLLNQMESLEKEDVIDWEIVCGKLGRNDVFAVMDRLKDEMRYDEETLSLKVYK
ncbi:hypothetical protein [Ichthyobacterium seriolicida]|uniref:Uncharacterized protein n=1 Tax=Ichthyobacterium seriolicida TaxID=242600 RepID=A0A1J1EAM0_9FLAO|nr:hypothetical protein [Ichthyobacterium seriolicida]BAV94987.1 hypothetical protein JBKA6_0974 [Ichthyobacterium seriolicida]